MNNLNQIINAISSLNDVQTASYNKTHNNILEYAYSRGLLKTQYDFFVCDDLMMKNRLIIPFYYNPRDSRICWQAYKPY